MKRKILYIAATAAIATTAFFAGKFAATTPTETITIEKEVVPENYIDLDNVRGWEHWENAGEVGIELQTADGNFEITKSPFTADGVSVTHVE